ncbi:hypothetical protein FNW52_10885 [Flavobacterium sp. ZT3R18]|uniref:hypothetical protein n=1 Tax=Flavobacterium sp. ZT3R18 TaxID=2594429 RepID=UPI00117B637A|nr:hypothetical protein [Flavobacterium sp. ZT3R18]TRX35537.1 hypothetical protein FNW52_10885 [Flavobacterium sp. ZT3R18]
MPIEEKNTITKLEVHTILNLKVNLANYSEPNKYSISIPDYYQANTTEYNKGQIDLKYGKLNCVAKEKTIVVELESALTGYTHLAKEEVSIIKESNPNLLTVEDIKKDLKTNDSQQEPIYYEDANSIIYGEEIQVICFGYDSVLKSYLVYQAEITGYGEDLTPKERLNLAIHMLKNGKNIFKKEYKNTPFNSWEQYVANTSTAEINFITKPYSNINKEIKAFLNCNENVSIPNSSANLYRVNLAMNETYLNFLDAIKSKNVINFNLPDAIHENFESTFFDYETNNKYTLNQIENVDVVKISSAEYETESAKLICHIEYQGKNFYIISKDVSQFTKDFYIKMFNYYSKNKTLGIPS